MAKVAVVYWSGSGNTEKMARIISEAASAKCIHAADAAADDVTGASVVALGCPALGDEWIDESEMLPFVDSCKDAFKDKKIALFGSHGWGSGEWLKRWREHLRKLALDVSDEVLAVRDAPDGPSEDECKKFGAALASLWPSRRSKRC